MRHTGHEEYWIRSNRVREAQRHEIRDLVEGIIIAVIFMVIMSATATLLFTALTEAFTRNNGW